MVAILLPYRPYHTQLPPQQVYNDALQNTPPGSLLSSSYTEKDIFWLEHQVLETPFPAMGQ